MGAANSILCRNVIRVLGEVDASAAGFDLIDISWNEHGRRTLRRQSRAGLLVRVLLPAHEFLQHGSVLCGVDEPIVVNLLPCRALVIRVETQARLAEICYTIGNLHLPAQITAREIAVPATEATEAALGRAGIPHAMEIRRVQPRIGDLPRVEMSREFQVSVRRSDADRPVQL